MRRNDPYDMSSATLPVPSPSHGAPRLPTNVVRDLDEALLRRARELQFTRVNPVSHHAALAAGLVQEEVFQYLVPHPIPAGLPQGALFASYGSDAGFSAAGAYAFHASEEGPYVSPVLVEATRSLHLTQNTELHLLTEKPEEVADTFNRHLPMSLHPAVNAYPPLSDQSRSHSTSTLAVSEEKHSDSEISDEIRKSSVPAASSVAGRGRPPPKKASKQKEPDGGKVKSTPVPKAPVEKKEGEQKKPRPPCSEESLRPKPRSQQAKSVGDATEKQEVKPSLLGVDLPASAVGENLTPDSRTYASAALKRNSSPAASQPPPSPSTFGPGDVIIPQPRSKINSDHFEASKAVTKARMVDAFTETDPDPEAEDDPRIVEVPAHQQSALPKSRQAKESVKATPPPKPSQKKKKNTDIWIEVKRGAPVVHVAPASTATSKGKPKPQEKTDEVDEVIFDEIIETEPKAKKPLKAKKIQSKKESEAEFDDILTQYQSAPTTESSPRKNTKQLQLKQSSRSCAHRLLKQYPDSWNPAEAVPPDSQFFPTVEAHLLKADATQNPKTRLSHLQTAKFLLGQHKGRTPALLVAEVNCDLADCLIELMDYENAREIAEEALQFARLARCAPLEMMALLVLGKALVNLVRPEPAKRALEDVLRLSQALNDQTHYAWALCCMGTVMELLGQFSDAFAIYHNSLRIATSLDDKKILAEVRTNIGVANLAVGEIETAERILSGTIHLARQTKDHQILSRVLNNLSYLYAVVDQPQRLKAVHDLEYSAAKEQGDLLCMAQAIASFGLALRNLHLYDEAMQCVERELEHVKDFCAKECNPRHNQGRLCESYANIGAICRGWGKLAKARSYHTKELQLAQGTEDAMPIAKALTNLGEVDVAEGKYHDAIKNAKSALQNLSALIPDTKITHLLKVTCTEVEWKALDCLEAAFTAIGQVTDAVRYADRKHLSILTQDMQAKAAGVDSTTNPFALSTAMPEEKVLSLCSRSGYDCIVFYSLSWEPDCDHARVYVLRPGLPTEFLTVPMTEETMFTLGAQSSSFRSTLVGSEFDTPLLPNVLAVRAEKLALSGKPHPESFDEHLHVLSTAFLEPLLQYLPPPSQANERSPAICFVTDGLIGNIPFAALAHPTVGVKDEGSPVRLIERYRVSVLPSIGALDGFLAFQDGSHPEPAQAQKVQPDRFSIISKEMFAVAEGQSDVSTHARTKFLKAVEAADRNGHCIEINLPCSFDLRDDYGGILCVETIAPTPVDPDSNEDQFTPRAEIGGPVLSGVYRGATQTRYPILKSEEIKDAVDLRNVPLMLYSAAPSSLCRVVHETYSTVLRSVFASGCVRHVTQLWVPPSQADDLCPSSTLRGGFEQQSSSSGGVPDQDYLTAYQDCLRRCIEQGIDVQHWSRWVYSGLS